MVVRSPEIHNYIYISLQWQSLSIRSLGLSLSAVPSLSHSCNLCLSLCLCSPQSVSLMHPVCLSLALSLSHSCNLCLSVSAAPLTHATSVSLSLHPPVCLTHATSVSLSLWPSVCLTHATCLRVSLSLSAALIPSHSHATSLCLCLSLCLRPLFCLILMQPLFVCLSLQPSFCLILMQPLFVCLSLRPLFCLILMQPLFVCLSLRPLFCLILMQPLFVCLSLQPLFCLILMQPLFVSLSLSAALILSHSHATSLCLSVSGSVSLHVSSPLSHSQIIVPLHIFTRGKVTCHPLMTDQLVSQYLRILHPCHTMLVLKTMIKHLASTQLEAQVPAHHPVYPACLSEQGHWTKGKRSTRLLSPEESQLQQSSYPAYKAVRTICGTVPQPCVSSLLRISFKGQDL